MKIRLWPAALLLLTMCGACASRHATSGTTDVLFEITIENPTDEMIQLFFEGENGTRRRIGTVLPRSVETVRAALVRDERGFFVARRLGQPEPTTGLGFRVNPLDLGGGRLVITLHPFPGLDTWVVRR